MIPEDNTPTEFEVALATQGTPFQYPEDEADRKQARDYGKFLALLVVGAEDLETIGRRAVFLAYLLKADAGPRTLTNLGAVMGITKQAAAKRLTAFKRVLPDIAREIGFDG